MQTKEELETWYQNKDPWGYETNRDDQIRKENIINAIERFCPDLKSIVDIGAGEGFVTKDLPADIIYGSDFSELAESRFPENVKRWNGEKTEAVISTGTLYQQYNHFKIATEIRETAQKYVIISGIKDWLVSYNFGKIIYQEEFPYREYNQQLTIYEVSH